MRKFVFAFSIICLLLMAGCGNDQTSSKAEGHEGTAGGGTEENTNQQVEIKDLEVVEYGYERDADGYLQVAGVFKNPNKEHTAKSAHINWTITGDNGVVIAEPSTVRTIRPGETVVMSFPAIQHQDFEEIKVGLEVKEENWIIEEAPLASSSDIALTDLVVEKNFYGAYVVNGYIENKSEYDISSVDVGMIFKKDGKIVGGAFREIYSPLKAGQKYDFNMASSIAFPEMDDYEIFLYNIEVK